jgi:hypothetical protein
LRRVQKIAVAAAGHDLAYGARVVRIQEGAEALDSRALDVRTLLAGRMVEERQWTVATARRECPLVRQDHGRRAPSSRRTSIQLGFGTLEQFHERRDAAVRGRYFDDS